MLQHVIIYLAQIKSKCSVWKNKVHPYCFQKNYDGRMPWKKDISYDLKEATDAAHQSRKGYNAMPKQFEVHLSRVRKVIHK